MNILSVNFSFEYNQGILLLRKTFHYLSSEVIVIIMISCSTGHMVILKQVSYRDIKLFPCDKRAESQITDFRQFGVDIRGIKPLESQKLSTKFLES